MELCMWDLSELEDVCLAAKNCQMNETIEASGTQTWDSRISGSRCDGGYSASYYGNRLGGRGNGRFARRA